MASRDRQRGSKASKVRLRPGSEIFTLQVRLWAKNHWVVSDGATAMNSLKKLRRRKNVWMWRKWVEQIDMLEVRLRCANPTGEEAAATWGQRWGNQTEIFLFSAGSRLSSLPPLSLTHQVFRSPCLVNRHLRLNISPVGSVCSGGGGVSEGYSDRSNTGIRASTEKKYNLVKIKSINVQSGVYCYCFY